MVAFKEDGQGYFTFEKLLEDMTLMELESLADKLVILRNSVLDEMKFLNLKGMDWFSSSLHQEMTEYANKLSLVLIAMNYKAWGD